MAIWFKTYLERCRLHLNSTSYRQQINKVIEVANKNIKNIARKMVVTYNDWYEMVLYALYVYRTTVKTSTGAASYSLDYGMVAVLLIEVEILSLGVFIEADLEGSEWV